MSSEMNDSKQIFTLMRAILEKWIAGCECGGSGKVLKRMAEQDSIEHGNIGPTSHQVPCPTCAPWRAMLEKVCWHECFFNSDNYWECKHCSKEFPDAKSSMPFAGLYRPIFNPDLTTHMTGSRLTLVDMLDRIKFKVRGVPRTLLEQFEAWHFNQCSVMVQYWMGDRMGKPLNQIQVSASSTILTDGKYLVEAVHSFLKEEMV